MYRQVTGLKRWTMTVVVGVDGSPDSYAAIRLAHEEAKLRNSRLVAVMAHGSDSAFGAPAARPLAPPRSADEQSKVAEATLHQAVKEALGGEDDEVELRAEVGQPGRVLVEAARALNAQMMVLATRREHVPSRILGAVSQYVLRNAPCPVLVVPEASKRL
jgi:nucleotide-binding universal stress UspA family protein